MKKFTLALTALAAARPGRSAEAVTSMACSPIPA